LARPRQEEKYRQNKMMTVRFNEDDYQDIKAWADELNMNISPLIRAHLMGRHVNIIEPIGIKDEDINQLNEYGRELKKIITGEIKANDREILTGMIEITRRIREGLTGDVGSKI
jgi:hypothetical protein